MAKAEVDIRKQKAEAIGAAVSQIEKQFGKGSIMRLGADVRPQVQGISTGALSLDVALGGMGLPRGRIVEIYGPESSGKTTLALTAVANAQRLGGVAAFIDAEHALDPTYARRLGVDVDNLLVSQPDTGEQGLEICEMLVRSNALDVAVIDSVAALVPRAEIEGEMGDSHVGLQARLMSQALRKLTAVISRTNTCLIFINQLREKIGVMFGSPETTTGGRALKFYATIRLDIRRIGSIKESDQIIGSQVRCTVKKNKLAPPFRKAEFDILFNEGISREGDLIDLGIAKGTLTRNGTWISMGETRLGQGRERAREFLRENRDVARSLEADIRKRLGLDRPAPGAGPTPAAQGATAAKGVESAAKRPGPPAPPARSTAMGASGGLRRHAAAGAGGRAGGRR